MENRPSIAQDEGRTRRESDRVAGRLAAHGAGARPNILALIRREWPWARPRLTVFSPHVSIGSF
jgi:hypothetical protein